LLIFKRKGKKYKMNITLKRTEEQVELVKAMASKNRDTAYEAQAALAAFLAPVLAEVINNAPTISNLFKTLSFSPDDNPSIPLDLYTDINDEDYVQVYSQSVPGGLPTSTVQPSFSEMKVTTYRLDSAVSFDRKFASKSRMDVVGKTFARVAQEILLKQERTSANLIMGALAKASTNGNKHIIDCGTDGRVLLDDFNRMLTLAKRIHTSWSGGSPVARRGGVTDLIVSPEVVQELRTIAYNPINTKGGVAVAGGDSDNGGATAIPATDDMRNQIYNSAGIPEFYGVNIMEINEMGVGQKFNKVFDAVSDDVTDSSKEELMLGLDRSMDSLMKVVALDAESGTEMSLLADDQYSVRQQKIGYYGSLEEGRVCLDDRALFGMIAKSMSGADPVS
jgi:hypothetical protein